VQSNVYMMLYKVQKHHEKSTYWKDEIGHSHNVVERMTKIHSNLKSNHIGNNL